MGRTKLHSFRIGTLTIRFECNKDESECPKLSEFPCEKETFCRDCTDGPTCGDLSANPRRTVLKGFPEFAELALAMIRFGGDDVKPALASFVRELHLRDPHRLAASAKDKSTKKRKR